MNPIAVTPRRSARNKMEKWDNCSRQPSRLQNLAAHAHKFFRVGNKKTSKHCFVYAVKYKLHVITAPGGMAFDYSYTQATKQGFQTTFLSCSCLWTKHFTFIQSQKPFKSTLFSQNHTKGLIFSIQKVETEGWPEKGSLNVQSGSKNEQSANKTQILT
jgi:hypothetical protein